MIPDTADSVQLLASVLHQSKSLLAGQQGALAALVSGFSLGLSFAAMLLQEDETEPQQEIASGQTEITEPQPARLVAPDHFTFTGSLEGPAWYVSLYHQLYELISPAKLPPLRITSRPVAVARLENPLWIVSLYRQVRDAVHPAQLPPLELTSKPADVKYEQPASLLVSLLHGLRDVVHPAKLPPLALTSKPVAVEEMREDAWYVSLYHQVSEILFPPKLPPLELTSKPVEVTPLFAKGRLASNFVPVSILLHAVVIAGILAWQIYQMFSVDSPLTTAMLTRSAVMLAPPPPPPPPPAAGPAMPRLAPVKVAIVRPNAMVLPKDLSPKLEEVTKIQTEMPEAPETGTVEGSMDVMMAGVPGGVPGGVAGGVAGGVVGGVLGGVIGGILNQFQPPEPPPAPKAEPKPVEAAPETPKRIVVRSEIQAGYLLNMVQPSYPVLARRSRVQGAVHLKALIGADGSVMKLQVIDGHPLLIPGATEAVMKWKYRPTMLNGQPVEVETEIEVNFFLH